MSLRLYVISEFINREYFLCVLSVTTEITQTKKLRKAVPKT